MHQYNSTVHDMLNVNLEPTEEEVAVCRNCPSMHSCQRLASGGIAVTNGSLRICCLHPRSFVLPVGNSHKYKYINVIKNIIVYRYNLVRKLGLNIDFETIKSAVGLISVAVEEYCNLKCIYCAAANAGFPHEEVVDNAVYLTDFLTIMKDCGIVLENSIFDVGGFEPTLSKNFEELLIFLNNNCQSGVLYTNATKFSPAVLQGLKKNLKIVTSLDSGTPDTYKRVKGRNLFFEVIKNLERYAEVAESVIIKYIVLKENCNKLDIDSFVDLICRLKLKNVYIAGDILHEKDDNILISMLYMRDELKKYGVIPCWNTLTIKISEQEAERKVGYNCETEEKIFSKL